MSTHSAVPFRPVMLLHVAGLLGLMAGLVTLPAAAQSGGNPADVNWESPFGLPGIGTGGRQAVVVGGELYVAGATYVVPGGGGGIGRAQFAIWNGETWRTDGEGALSIGHGINDMAAVGADIYIGGNFMTVGGVSAAYIARWDGSEWHALGDGVNGLVGALATDGQGNLYVGGSFTMAGGQPARNVAMWDGSSWSNLSDLGGSGDGVNGGVTAITVAGDKVYVGGAFTEAGQQAATSIASWNRATGDWEAVGGGVQMNGFPTAGIVDIVVANDRVYVGGDMDWANNDGGQVAVSNLAMFESGSWQAMGAGSSTSVMSMGVSPDGAVFANGDFSDPATGRQEGVAEWDGSAWTPLNLDEYAWQVTDMVWFDESLIAVAAQYSSTPGNRRTNGIGRWTGTEWRSLGDGIGGPVLAIAEHEGALYAGGNYYWAGDTGARSLARYDGTRWSVVGGGLPVNSQVLQVSALASTSAGLVAGGYFGEVGGVTARNVALWDGANWSPMGEGLRDFAFDPPIRRLQVVDGVLHAGGVFLLSGSDWVRGVARWTGTAWEAVGGGAQLVDAFAARPGQIVIGANGPNLQVDYGPTGTGTPTQVENVALWDGANWSGVGGGVDGGVHAIEFQGDDIIVGGLFGSAGGITANNIAKWDGSTWITFGDGVNGRVRAVHVNGSDVYVGGDFTQAGGVPVGGVARWDGAAWHALGSGLLQLSVLGSGPAQVTVLTGTNSGLYVGGAFTTAGATYSENIAVWSDYDHINVGIETAGELPNEWGILGGNYPNPFSTTTRVRFELARPADISLRVYDVLGRIVDVVLDGARMGAGDQQIDIDASSLPAGTYYYRLTVDGRAESRSFVVVR